MSVSGTGSVGNVRSVRSFRGQVQSVDITKEIVEEGKRLKLKAIGPMVHTLFVEIMHRWDLFTEAKATKIQLCEGPIDRYEEALNALTYACNQGLDEARADCVRIFCPAAWAKRQAENSRYDDLSDTLRATFKKRPDIIFHASRRVSELARKGGAEYDELLSIVKFARSDLSAHNRTMTILFPDAVKQLAVQPVKTPASVDQTEESPVESARAAGINV